MNPHDAVILNLDANDGHIDGRAALQKLAYFEKIQTEIDITFVPHYYGPYSKHIAAALADLVASEYVDERRCKENRYERYFYILTEYGRKFAETARAENSDAYSIIQSVVSKCKDCCDLKADTLSYAAKAHYLLSDANVPESRVQMSKVKAMAETLGWDTTDADVKTGMDLLVELELATG